ncbi:phosphatase PAP2 family protein [Bifidobacterium xylocopae]|nr:phosphatase PAP2 family protein [Bifidobacterium xylocopae]
MTDQQVQDWGEGTGTPRKQGYDGGQDPVFPSVGAPDPGLAGLAGGQAFPDPATAVDPTRSSPLGRPGYSPFSPQADDPATLASLQDLQGLARRDDQAAADDPEQLERMDPLTVRPHTSSWIACLALGIAFLLAAAGVWWLGVRTATGQQYDDEVYRNFAGYLARAPWLAAALNPFHSNGFVLPLCVVIAVAGGAVAALRKRWWLLGQLAVFMAICLPTGHLLKRILPRPYLINVESMRANTAPSGHTLLMATVCIVLVCSVPRTWRALCALLGCLLTTAMACSLIFAHWHRPIDVIVSILLAGGLALIMLALTRGSGMDAPGTRASSASVQILSTVMLTAGVLGLLYGCYLVWQMASGLELGESWTFYGAHVSAVVFIASVAAIVFGAVLAMRQVTASPLSKIGLLGAPPTPPDRG